MSHIDNKAEERLDEVLSPMTKKGNQEDNDRLELISSKEFEAERARRASTDPRDQNFLYCIVFPTKPPEGGGMMEGLAELCMKQDKKTEAKFDDERFKILKAIEEAGLKVECVFSTSGNEILVKIGANDDRLLGEAELKSYKLELNELSVKHVLELGIKKIYPDFTPPDLKPKHPVFLDFEHYTEAEFDEIQNQGGPDTLPIFRQRERHNPFSPRLELSDKPISVQTARKSFLDQTKKNPFKHLHFEYDPDWEQEIIDNHNVQLYKRYNDGTILRTVDRIDLIQTALERETSARKGLRGANLDLDNLVFEGAILAHYPIQHSSQIRRAGDLTAEQIFDKFQWKTNNPYFPPLFLPFRQPVQDVRDYCGEKIAYYFAFLEYYSFWLVFSVFFGLALFFVQLAHLKQETGEADIVTAPAQVVVFDLNGENPDDYVDNLDFTSDRTPFAVSRDGLQVLLVKTPTELPFAIAVYAVLISFWATFFLEFWKRKQATLAFKWGVSDYERTAEVRPEFQSFYDVPDAVTGLPTPYRSLYRYGVKLTLSFSFVAFLVGCSVAAFAATYVFKAFMSSDTGIDPTAAVQIALVLNGAAISILGMIFQMIATMLTDWENHRTDIEYEDQLIGKTFVFSFFNSYTTLIYFAFFKSGSKLSNQNQYCVAELEDFELRNTSDDDFDPLLNQNFAAKDLFKVDTCYGSLGYSLIIIFATQLIVNNFMELGIPYLSQQWTKRQVRLEAKKARLAAHDPSKAGTSMKVEDGFNKDRTEQKLEEAVSKGVKLRSPAEIQFLLAPYESPFNDYLELALQFGYVTLFVAAFPLAPFLALLNNFVEVWVDASKVCRYSRRPQIKKAQDIGTWLYIFEILGYIAIVTNSAVLIFTSVELVPLGISVPENKVWAFLAFVLCIFGVKYFVSFFINDVPTAVKIMQRRQEYIKQKIFFDTEDDIDKLVITKEQYKKFAQVHAGEEGPRDDAEFAEKVQMYQPLDTDPYMHEIIDEIKDHMNECNVNRADLFGMLDTDNSETISLKEFQRALMREDIGIGRKADPEVVKLFVGSLDLNNDGNVTREELDAFLDAVAPELPKGPTSGVVQVENGDDANNTTEL